MQKERNYTLDFIKVLSALFIVLHHYWQITNIQTSKGINFYGGYITWGYIVELFFVISGFLMYKYIKIISERKISVKEWYLKRALRLLPMVVISVLVYDIALCVYHKIDYVDRFIIFNKPLDIKGSILTCIGLQEGFGVKVNSPLWYVSVLIICYMIFYLITYISAYLKIKPYIFYLAMAVAGVVIFQTRTTAILATYNTSRGYYSFFTGVLLACLLNKIKSEKLVLSISLVIIAAFAAVFRFEPQDIIGIENYLLTFLLYPAIVAVSQQSFVKQLFRNKLWGEVGAVSYGVYIWHVPMLLIWFTIIDIFDITVDFADTTTIAAFLAAVVVVAVISYYFVEKPISKKINKIINGKVENR